MKRPRIICHMIATIDGKILTARWKGLDGNKSTGALYNSMAADFGVGSWLVGTSTMRELFAARVAIRAPREKVPAGDFIANADAETHAIGTDTRGELRFDSDEYDGDHVIVLTTRLASEAYKAHLRKVGVSYLICGRERVDMKVALEKLASGFGIKEILLEGGGVFNGAMLRDGLIDEISQIVVPIADGGGPEVTGLYDTPHESVAKGKKAMADLDLVQCKALTGGAVWLHYKVKG